MKDELLSGKFLVVKEICQKNSVIKKTSKDVFFEFELQNETTYVVKVEKAELSAASTMGVKAVELS